jgi:hypothetical protein
MHCVKPATVHFRIDGSYSAAEKSLTIWSPYMLPATPAFSGSPVAVREILYIPQCVKAAVTSYRTTTKLRVPVGGDVHEARTSAASDPVAALAQAPGKPAIDLPDPYGPGVKFGELQAGRQWGGVIAIIPDRDGHNIWAFERCGSVSCVNSDLPTSP